MITTQLTDAAYVTLWTGDVEVSCFCVLSARITCWPSAQVSLRLTFVNTDGSAHGSSPRTISINFSSSSHYDEEFRYLCVNNPGSGCQRVRLQQMEIGISDPRLPPAPDGTIDVKSCGWVTLSAGSFGDCGSLGSGTQCEGPTDAPDKVFLY